jgi:putative transposase
MKLNRAYKFRLYPSKDQQKSLDKTLGCCRFIWNQMLHERTTTYERLKDDKEVLYAHKYKTEKEYKQIYPFLKEADSNALQASRRNLEMAFKFFFRGLKEKRKVGYPSFKSRKNKQAYTTFISHNNIKINFETNRIKIPKIKTWIKYRDDRIFAENIKHITVSKTKSGKYFVAICLEREFDIIPKTILLKDNIQAYDMSFPYFLVSTQQQFQNPRFFRSEERRLKKLHKKVSRKKKDSNNWNKARLRLSRKYEQIYNRKNDWTHKISHKLAKEHDAIILEDLNVEGMKQFGKGHAKSLTLDFSWGQFVAVLSYKLKQQGKYLILVDRWFPSSKLCSQCGWKNSALKLSEREWICPQCKSHHNRDQNSSKNLFREGIAQLQASNITIKPTVGATESYA